MRFSSAAVTAVCLLSATTKTEYADAFSITTPVISRSTQSSGSNYQGRQSSLAPLQFKVPGEGGEASGGIVELQELTENRMGTVLEKQIQKSPSFWKMAGYASIPVSAALGFGIVPSRRLAAHAAGAIVTGIAGAVGKSKLDSVSESVALPAIAQTIVDHGIEDSTTTNGYIKSVKELYGITDDDDFEAMCADVYSKYLVGMVKPPNHIPVSNEPKELGKLKTALGLSNLWVGEAHAAAAQELYKSISLETPEEDLKDLGHPDRQSLDKFLYLTERALKQGGETDDAFKFEMSRVAKAMTLSTGDAIARANAIKEHFYTKALYSTRAKLGSGKVSEGVLARARQTLGVGDEKAHDMHVSCLADEVQEQLGVEGGGEADASKLKFSDDTREKLTELAKILGLEDGMVEYEIESITTPLFESMTQNSLKSVVSGVITMDEAWGKIETRRKELLLPEDKCSIIFRSAVYEMLVDPLQRISKFSKANNEVAVYENLLEQLAVKDTISEFLTNEGIDGFDDFNDALSGFSSGKLNSGDRVKMYEIFLRRTVQKSGEGRISDEMNDSITDIQGLLGISEDQAEESSRSAFGKKLDLLCRQAYEEITEDYTPQLAKTMASMINETVEHFKFNKSVLRNFGSQYYTKAVEAISAKSPGGIPTREFNEALEELRLMYGLEKEDTYEDHLRCFGSVYTKSVLEAMGSIGIIKPELQDGLADLRDRLGIPEEDTKKLFLSAVEKKFVPMMDWIYREMERTQLSQQQLSERRGKDMGEDVFQSGKAADGTLGLGAEVNLMGDVINLVDFYTENKVAEEKEIGTKEVDGEEVPVLETSYPITAIGCEIVEPKIAEFLYRQFVVGAFTAQGEKASRYEGARATFGGILGLTSEKMEEINNTIGEAVYDNFVSRSMAQKGALDQQDMMFLANIQTKLGISSETGEKFMMDSQKKVLTQELSDIMTEATPESIKVFREKCNSMGLDLADDIGITTNELVRMFELEITPAVKSGELTMRNPDAMIEVQESLNMDASECEAILIRTVEILAKEALELAQSELLRGREEKAIESIKELVRYAAYFDGELDLEVEEADAWSIYNLYEALDFSEQDADDVEMNKEFLMVALGIFFEEE